VASAISQWRAVVVAGKLRARDCAGPSLGRLVHFVFGDLRGAGSRHGGSAPPLGEYALIALQPEAGRLAVRGFIRDPVTPKVSLVASG
jgi:hypothetical protein